MGMLLFFLGRGSPLLLSPLLLCLPLPRSSPSSFLNLPFFPLARLLPPHSPPSSSSTPPSPSAPAPSPPSPDRITFALRRGQLRIEARAGPSGRSAAEVANLKLDELELASLRGFLEQASVSLDFGARAGHGAISVRGPRFSGLQGTSLEAKLLWDDGVVQLSNAVLEQVLARLLACLLALPPVDGGRTRAPSFLFLLILSLFFHSSLPFSNHSLVSPSRPPCCRPSTFPRHTAATWSRPSTICPTPG